MSDNDAVQRFFGYLLMAVGGLIAVLCGGCTAYFLWIELFSPFGGFIAEGHASLHELFNNFMQVVIIGVMALIFGSLPTVVGVALFVAGRRMAKDER
jgi:hypothetical protein